MAFVGAAPSGYGISSYNPSAYQSPQPVDPAGPVYSGSGGPTPSPIQYLSPPQYGITVGGSPTYAQSLTPAPAVIPNPVNAAAANNNSPFITSGSTGRIVPTEQPYAFTTVTYAKVPGTTAATHEEFKKQYLKHTKENPNEFTTSRPRQTKRQTQPLQCC